MSDLKEHYWCEGIENPNSQTARFVKPGFISLMSHIRDWGEEFITFWEKLHGREDEVCKKVIETLQNAKNFVVLNHGDLHAKNMMFRNDGTKGEDLIFVSIIPAKTAA